MAKLLAQLSMGIVVGVLLIGMTASTGWSDDDDEIPFEVAEIFFELNHTDGDLGIHAFVDGEPWRNLKIFDPSEDRMLGIWVNGRLKRQGVNEIFFESAEPSFDELSPRSFFKRFPAGTYEFEGLTLEGQELESEAELTHILPAPPSNIQVSGLPAAEDCETETPPEIDGPVIISWDPVTMSHPDIGKSGRSIEVVNYELVVEREEPISFTHTVTLPPSVTEIEIPAEFIALGEEFKFGILVQEASGNRTAIESCFTVD